MRGDETFGFSLVRKEKAPLFLCFADLFSWGWGSLLVLVSVVSCPRWKTQSAHYHTHTHTFALTIYHWSCRGKYFLNVAWLALSFTGTDLLAIFPLHFSPCLPFSFSLCLCSLYLLFMCVKAIEFLQVLQVSPLTYFLMLIHRMVNTAFSCSCSFPQKHSGIPHTQGPLHSWHVFLPHTHTLLLILPYNWTKMVWALFTCL